MVGCPWRGTSGGRLVRFYERGCRLRAGRTRNMPLHHRYTKGAPGGMRVLHVCALAITQGTHTSMHLHIKERDAIRRLQAQRVRREQAHRMMSRHVAMGSQSDSYIHKCGDADADGDATTLTYVSPSLALFHLRKALTVEWNTRGVSNQGGSAAAPWQTWRRPQKTCASTSTSRRPMASSGLL